MIEHHTPDAIIITETNIWVHKNLSYFGNANEAPIIYNFSLPPLLLHALLSGNCHYLNTWIISMPKAIGHRLSQFHRRPRWDRFAAR